MIRRSRVAWTAAILSVLAISAAGAIKSATPPAKPEDSDFRAPAKQNWPMANGDLENTHYSTLSQINTETVKNLGAGWVSDKFDNGAVSRVTPVVNNGVMFITAGDKVYALDAATGKTIWKVTTTTATTPGGIPTGRGVPSGSPSRQGVAVADGKVFSALTNAHYIALDEKTGKVIWNRSVCEECTPATRPGITSSPVYANGVLYSAVTFGEARYCGRLIALDANDGHLLWRFDTIPGPGQPGHETWAQNNDVYTMGGGDSWQPPVVDLDLGLAYYGTGNPSPNRQAGWARPGNNLYTSTVLAIDIKTGKLRWYYQLIHHDMWEGDLGTPHIAYDTEINGVKRKVLGAYRPDGTLFLLDRATGKPVWPVEERSVRPSALLKASPTQPYPVGRGSLTERPCAELTAPAGFIMRCESGLFQPPSDDPPNALSYYPGVRNVSMSYNPQTGYIYLQGSDELTWNWASRNPPTWELGITNFLRDRVPFIEKQDVMEYEAVDPKTYKVVWRKTLPMPESIYGAGGFLTTAGNLAFHRLEDGNIIAWDAKTGDELWKFQTGVSDNGAIQTATPMTYEAGGQQYVSIVMMDHVWAFGLGGTIPQRPATKLPPHGVEALQGQYQDSQIIRASVPNDFDYRHQISPLKTRVKAGSEVTFLNNGSDVHEFMADTGEWTTGRLLPRQQALLTFDKPGIYLYHCKNHPWVYGMLMVTDATTTASVPVNAPARNQAAPAQGGTQATFVAQAARGKDAYQQQCSLCHQPDMGGNDFIPALVGSAFESRWQGHTGKDLLDRTQASMPSSAPGSLSAQTYLDLVAFMLQTNDMVQSNAVSVESLNSLVLH